MKQEPVAWMEYIQDEEWEVWFVEPTNLPKGHTYKPLYTAPRELSDEEIENIWHELYPLDSNNYWEDNRKGLCQLRFARAILKKASEK